MRSPFAYVPRRRPLQLASPSAAVAYLGALVVVAFAYSNPLVLAGGAAAVTLAGLLAGARGPVRAGWRMGLALLLLIAVVNAFVSHRGETVLARLGHWPVIGQNDITLEAIVEGLNLGFRALVVMVAFAVYSACVDPDRVLRALRPLAGRSALTATLVSRLVPVAAADAARLRDAAALRGPGAAAVGKAPLARRLLAGSLDRAVDVAATLELRGYSLDAPLARNRHRRSRYDGRFYAAGVLLLAVAIAGKLLGADGFGAYPAVQISLGPTTIAVAALVALSGLAPLRHGPIRRIRPVDGTKRPSGRDRSARRRGGLDRSARRRGVAGV
ncbi:MAG TPA: energy-coupling factor transporter transmembrane component T [Solirubrobacterales bacterium]|nr:energy-coupling factor transporter transmembrane component T [Solirubrobacterales bacterium]